MTRQRFIRTLGAILLVLSVLLGEAGCASCSMRNPEQQTDTDSGTHPDRDPSTKEAVTNREEPTESEAEPCDHTYTSSVTPATCTTDGYTIHTCSKCGDGYVDSWVKPVGHTWGEWSVTTPATCYTSGVQTRQCTVCAQSDTATLAQLTHDYVSDGTCEKDGTTYTVYTCANCNHTELAKEAEVPSSVTQDFVYNCDNDFYFTVRFDGSESELRERLTIVESQAEGTQYDKAGAAQVAYTLSKQGDGTWIVKPTGSYENGTRYAARLTDDSAYFAEYEGNRLNFTTTRTDDQEVIRLNDDILFLKALEERYPGYYPFETTDPDENGTVYVTVGRADHLKVGDLLCIGDYLNEAEIIEQKADIHSYHIGKISAILPEHGAFILVLEQPEISEVYEELNVSLHIDWDRLGEEMDEEAQAELDNLALNTLLEDDGFVTYLVSMERASAEYLVQRGLTPMWDMELEFSSDFDIGKYFKVSCSAELMSYDKYVDSEYYEEGFWGISSYWLESKGTKVVIVAKAEITGTFPFSNTEGNANGNLIVKASVDCTSGTYMDITYADGKYTIGLIYAWITGETSSRVRIELSVHCDIHYTAEQEDTPFVKNEKTGTYHCAYCRIVEQNKATTTFTPLKAGQMASVVKDSTGNLDGKMFCGVCKPQSAILGDYLFVNTNDKCLHIATCSHVTQNAIPITGMASVLENQGYWCCKDCDPKGKQSECIAEKISAKMKAGGMESELKLMKEALKDLVKESGATCSDKSDKKHLVSVELPVAGPIGIYVQFDFVFDFDLEGQAMYVFECSSVTAFDGEYTCTHWDWEDKSLKKQGFNLKRCETTTKKVERSDLTLEGTINTRVGGQLGIGVYFGSQKALSFGLHVGAGLYADLNGYLKADFNNDDWWGGAWFEAGLYVDAGLEGRLIFYDWEYPFFNWENTKTPLLNLGYDEIWTSFVTTPTEVEIQALPHTSAYSNQKYRDGYILNPEDFLEINTYDLKQMESSTKILAFGNHPVYKARIEENSDYFDVVNGVFCVSKDAPAEFVGTFHVVVETTTTWNQYKEGSAVSYLDVYTVSVHYGEKDPYSKGLRYSSNHDGTCAVSGIGSCKDKDVVIPPVSPEGESVTSIGESAFYECSSLTSIMIPDSVTSIGDDAFYKCSGLTGIVIPDSVTSIGDDAFYKCSGLTSIVIPNNMINVGNYVFAYCTSLKWIVIPNSVTSIGEAAFYECTSLTSILIPDSMKLIGDNAFYDCSNLTYVIYRGSKKDWINISIGKNNEYLLIAYNNQGGLVMPEEADVINCWFDTVYVNGKMYFEEDGLAGDKLDALDNTIIFKSTDAHESMKLRGWIGFSRAIDSFGYIIDYGERVYDETFTAEPEYNVKRFGGKYALRFEILVPLTEMAKGNHSITFIVKLENGTIVRLRTDLTIVIEQ